MATEKDMRFAVADAGEVSAILLRPADARCLLVLAHGAGAGMRHSFMEEMAEELAGAKVATLRFNFPYMEQRRKVPDRAPVPTEAVLAAVRAAAEAAPELPLFAGGKSYGGRMSSQAAADISQVSAATSRVSAKTSQASAETSQASAARTSLSKVRGVVFFGFPLHPPDQPSTKRAEHLAQVKLPMLFLQGTRDKLADLSLLRPICAKLGSRATLHIIETADHSFHVLKSSGKTDAEVMREMARTVGDWTDKIIRQESE
jgi:predicted alpha/beta-hydrolase family hydrolase